MPRRQRVPGFFEKAARQFIERILISCNDLCRLRKLFNHSRVDFAHKISICAKEARETGHWVRMIVGASPAHRVEARPVWREARELTLVFGAIVRLIKTSEGGRYFVDAVKLHVPVLGSILGKTAIARFHNVYGPHGTWDGGREKAPAAICRKVIEAKDTGRHEIVIWGDGQQTRSFMYIDDCVQGIDMITHCDELVATPINLGSSELISINALVSLAEEIGGITLERSYDPDAPRGVAGRNSDNTFIQQVLGWEPRTPLRAGLAKTYAWIEQQYADRKAGRRTVRDHA